MSCTFLQLEAPVGTWRVAVYLCPGDISLFLAQLLQGESGGQNDRLFSEHLGSLLPAALARLVGVHKVLWSMLNSRTLDCSNSLGTSRLLCTPHRQSWKDYFSEVINGRYLIVWRKGGIVSIWPCSQSGSP